MMSSCAVAVVDVGTSGVHVGLVDSRGVLLYFNYQKLEYAVDNVPGALLIDTTELLGLVVHMMRKVVTVAQGSGMHICAISVTSQRHGVVFADQEGHVIVGFPNIDMRAHEEAGYFLEAFGEEIYMITSRLPEPIFPAVRLVWLRKRMPNVYAKITKFSMLNSWIASEMTGRDLAEWTNAAETLLFDVRNLSWSPEVIEIFGLEQIELPKISAPGTVVGTLKSGISSKMDLPSSTPVVLAAADTQCALIGAGGTGLGAVTVVSGSTTPIQMVVNSLVFDEEHRVWLTPFISTNERVLESNCRASGLVYRDLVDDLKRIINLFSPGIRVDYEDVDRMLWKFRSSTQGNFAFLGPVIPGKPPYISGVSYILRYSSSSHVLSSLLPSFIENLAFAIFANIEQLEETSGLRASSVFITGGMNRSSLLRYILYLLLKDRNISFLPEYNSTIVGAAMLAFSSLKIPVDTETKTDKLSLQKFEAKRTELLEKDRFYYVQKYKKWRCWLHQTLDDRRST